MFNFVTLVVIALRFQSVSAITASPFSTTQTLIDGSTVNIRKIGDEFGHLHILEKSGNIVVPVLLDVQSNVNGDGNSTHHWDWHFAQVNASGYAKSTGVSVRSVDMVNHPKSLQGGITNFNISQFPTFKERLRKNRQKHDLRSKLYSKKHRTSNIGRKLSISSERKINNLVINMRFKDHANRNLPTVDDLNELMNAPGGTERNAPTGSVYDVYMDSSYGNFEIISYITEWYTCSKTELQAAGTESGVGEDAELQACMREALDHADSLYNFTELFDADGDQEQDAIAFFHSGYGAETDQEDCFGTAVANRIWSHMGHLESSWESSEGIRIQKYHISSSMWGTCGSEIAHIGVVAHETGHFLGLPDLYDTTYEGRGLGTFGLMADAWGEQGDQLNPPMLSSWSKIELGWINPITIDTLDKAGTYELCGIGDNQDVLKITFGFDSEYQREYLLLANYQPYGVDAYPPDTGILILHIDESTLADPVNSVRGYPGQTCWPWNGNHYMVAVMGAHGKYLLENVSNINYQIGDDSGTCYAKSMIGVIDGATIPSTHQYHLGYGVKMTGISITVDNDSSECMNVTISLDGAMSGQVVDGGSCGNGNGAGDYLACEDCLGNSCEGVESWVGDSYCDDGMYGLYFNCARFECDGGDCPAELCDISETSTLQETTPSQLQSTSAIYSDCVGEWLNWGTCSTSCGAGYHTRSFHVTSQLSGIGNPCFANEGDIESKSCHSAQCESISTVPSASIIDCIGSWGPWASTCSVTCDGAPIPRTFNIISDALNGGNKCNVANETVEFLSCNVQSCSNGNCDGAWGPWSVCPVSCGGAVVERTFVVEFTGASNTAGCVTDIGAVETISCATEQCNPASSTSQPMCIDCKGEQRSCSRIGDGICDVSVSTDADFFTCDEYNADNGDCGPVCSDCNELRVPCNFKGNFQCDDGLGQFDLMCEIHNYDDGDCYACSQLPSWSQDGYCDVAYNNFLCDWDGGDCCKESCYCDSLNSNCFGDCETQIGQFRNCVDPMWTTTEGVTSMGSNFRIDSLDSTSFSARTTMDDAASASAPDCQEDMTMCLRIFSNDFSLQECLDFLASEDSLTDSRLYAELAAYIGLSAADVFYVDEKPLIECGSITITFAMRTLDDRMLLLEQFDAKAKGDVLESGITLFLQGVNLVFTVLMTDEELSSNKSHTTDGVLTAHLPPADQCSIDGQAEVDCTISNHVCCVLNSSTTSVACENLETCESYGGSYSTVLSTGEEYITNGSTSIVWIILGSILACAIILTIIITLIVVRSKRKREYEVAVPRIPTRAVSSQLNRPGTMSVKSQTMWLESNSDSPRSEMENVSSAFDNE